MQAHLYSARGMHELLDDLSQAQLRTQRMLSRREEGLRCSDAVV
jgi:hypothetical protein